MKKSIIAAMILTALLCGCGQTDPTSDSKSEKTTAASTTVITESTTTTETTESTETASTRAANSNDYLGSDDFWDKVDSGSPLTQDEWDYLVTTDKYKQDMAMQSAGYTVLEIVGSNYKITGTELVEDDNGEFNVYRVGYTRIDGSDPTVYYYCVSSSKGAYPDGAIPSDVQEKEEEEWQELVESDEFKDSMAEQTAGYNALERAGEGYKIVSSEKLSDETHGTYFRVGVTKIDGSDSTVTYYLVNEFFCVEE